VGRNPYDPEFRGACTLYNVSLEQSLRIEFADRRFAPGQTITIQTASGPCDITCRLRGGEWDPNEFDRFDFVSNYEITGLKNQYQSYGLGVPLIAVRKSYRGEVAAARYYPPNLSFPVTAFVRPVPLDPAGAAPDGSVRRHAELDLYDPLTTDSILTSNTRVPLQSDLSTPLAYFLSDPTLNSWADDGLLRPDRLLTPRGGPLGQHERVMGLYMVQPYQAGKIPVLFVHGLWSSPMTWMEMFNDLRSSPEIRSRYQFWFYLYPTTQPFWISAAQLRRDLAEVRRVVDPQSQEPALDQMVVIGHSMGGLVAKLQTVNSGDDFWRLACAWPFQTVKAPPELRDHLRDTFYFQPNPSIRRIITIATPFHGSPSSKTTQWLLGKLIKPVQVFVQGQQQLFRENPGAFAEQSLLKIENSVDSLEPSTPIFPVMLSNRGLPWLKCNNIIGLLPPQELVSRFAPGTDGVVSVESAHLDNAESELIVPAAHMTIHTHPLVVLEVRRILMAHLAALEAFPQTPQQTAAQTPQP
jgi:pimeloyl-ACP methyl ester carboxylesterase